MADITVFKLLGLEPARFSISEEQVEEAWRRVIALVHPDRFAGKSAAERRVAEQWAGRINEAKETLLSPVSRALVLLKSAGVDAGIETDTRMDGAFLMQQMAWREAAFECEGDAAKIAEVIAEIEEARKALVDELAVAIDTDRDWEKARTCTRKLMFIEKIRRDIERGM